VKIFFDSSAWAKRYLREPNTDRVLQLCELADQLVLSAIVLPEVVSAFCRLHREEKISDDVYKAIKQSLLADIEDAIICDVTAPILSKSILALENHALRAMDAIHIGSAIALGVDLFVSSDRRQTEAATKLGLKSELV
jgi:uncharacterized protein